MEYISDEKQRREAFLKSVKDASNMAGLGVTTNAPIKGYKGVIDGFDVIIAPGLSARPNDQAPQVIFGMTMPKDHTYAGVLAFKDKRTLAISTFFQSPRTTINGKPINDLSGAEWAAMVGGTFTITDVVVDSQATPIERPAVVNQVTGATIRAAQTRQPKSYTITVGVSAEAKASETAPAAQ